MKLDNCNSNDMICYNGGTCVDGDTTYCICGEGYSGSNCEKSEKKGLNFVINFYRFFHSLSLQRSAQMVVYLIYQETENAM